MNLSNQELRHDSSRARPSHSQGTPASPLAQLIAETDYAHRLLILLQDIKVLRKHHDLLEQADKDVARVEALLLTENESIMQQQEPLVPVEAIEDSIEWLIVQTPLLNLLCSGFLTFYTKNVKNPSYTLCLSPWLSTTVMAKKMLGSLPLTYLNQCEGETTARDEAEDLEAAEESASSLSGALIWERMMEQK